MHPAQSSEWGRVVSRTRLGVTQWNDEILPWSMVNVEADTPTFQRARGSMKMSKEHLQSQGGILVEAKIAA